MKVGFGVGVKEAKVTVLANDAVDPLLMVDERFSGIVSHAGTAGCLGEHGISLLVQVKAEDKVHTVLFDTGGLKATVINNMRELGVDPSLIECVVISHGHYDHFGALVKVMEELGRGSNVVLHPDVFSAKYALRGTPVGAGLGKEEVERLVEERRAVRLPSLSREQVELAAQLNGLNVVEVAGPVELAPGVWASGEIPLRHPDELSLGLFAERGGKIVPDDFRDEKSLYIKVEGKGVVVLTGCCHRGIANTLEDARRFFESRVYAVIGGLHMGRASHNGIDKAVEKIREANPEILSPLHCSGVRFTARLLHELPEKTVVSAAGTTFKF